MPDTPPKIADGIPKANEILGDRFTTATTNDGKLWFVSRKFADQPSISYFHETPLQGGNLVFFDTHTKIWSKPAPFAPISDEELLEGHVFGCKNRLLLLTYQRSKQFGFRGLYEWRDNEWRRVDHFEADEKTKFECGDHTTMKHVTDESGNVYLVAECGHGGLNVSKFQISDDGKKASIILQQAVTGAFPPNACGAHLVRVAASGHHLYGLYGQQGCGFRWEPTHPFRVNLGNGTVERIDVGSEYGDGGSAPPWAFSGAYADHFLPASHWYFLGGCRARGLSSTEEDTSIWIMDLEKKDWKRFEACDLPAGARFVGAFGSDKGSLKFYVVNVNSGVYEIEPEKAH